MDLVKEKEFLEKTRSVFLWTRILNIPFWTIYSMLAVILYKDLHATPWQIVAITAIKPLSSLFSPYWSLSINERPDRLVSNLVYANILKFLPFLFFPWIDNNWILVFSFGFYMMLSRGVIPAWMEIIKIHIKGGTRERVFATGSLMDYMGSAILPLALGWVLDDFPGSWRLIFFGTAAIGILSTLLLYQLPSLSSEKLSQVSTLYSEKLLEPWKQGWQLIKKRPDFANYQVGFMLGGSALIMIQTTLPMYYVDVLALSYKEIVFAIAICKSIGFALMTPSALKWFDKLDIYRFTSLVTISAALFPLLLICAGLNQLWIYAAFIVYGMMQAGSELSWHMSGPHFAKSEDSSPYSRVNVLTVGIRGCIAPLCGSLIYTFSGSLTVMILSFLLCLLATARMRSYSKKYYGAFAGSIS